MTIGIPEAITAQEANELTMVAACIRNGGQDITFKSMKFLVAPDSPMLREDTITDLTVVHELEARVFGHVIPLGKTACEMPPLRILSRVPARESGEGYELITLAPASGGPVALTMTLQPLADA
jgi:hypothetical protein